MERTIQRELKTTHWTAGGLALASLFFGGPSTATGMFLFMFATYFGIQALRAASAKEFIRIDAEGFTIKSLWGERRERWADIEAFYVVTSMYMLIPYRRRTGYRYVKEYQQSAVRKVMRFVNRWDRLLPDNFGMKAKDLAALLELSRRSAPPTLPSMQGGQIST